MRIINILFNYKKSTNDQHILGVERCFIDYAKFFILNGNEVFSVTKNGMVYCDDIKKTGSGLLEVSAFGNGDIFSMIRMAILFFNFKADAIICHSGRALFFARAARFLCRQKTPIIAIDHGINPTKFLKADYVLTVNSHFSKELINAGKSPETALVIPNMIEVPKNFVPLTKPAFRKPLKIGALGRIYPEKNFDKILRAMAILRDRNIECEYVIGGVGPMEGSLNDLAKELKLENNFKILGWVEDKRKFFEEIDIFILPSYGETFGIVLLEAMLYSTPIISSNSWGPNEVIQEGVNGLKVAIENHDAVPGLLAEAIEKMVTNEAGAKKMAENAYNGFFVNYSAEMVGKKLNEIMMMVKENAGK